MGLAEIEQKISDEAAAAATKIGGDALTEAAKLEAAAREQSKVTREEIIHSARSRAHSEIQATIIPARLAAKAAILTEKHRILDEVFAGVPPATREAKEIEVANFLYG